MVKREIQLGKLIFRLFAGALLGISCLSASAATITPLNTVPGNILDVSGDRILWTTDYKSLLIRDRNTNLDTAAFGAPAEYVNLENAFLTPYGAIYNFDKSSILSTNTFELHNGTVENVGQLGFHTSVNGNTAVFYGLGPMVRRDLATGTNQSIVSSVATQVANQTRQFIDPNGDVVYYGGYNDGLSNYDVYRLHNGVSTRLTHAPDKIANTDPLSDGANVVYQKVTLFQTGSGTRGIFMTGTGGETTLVPVPADPNTLDHIAGSYLANSGWIVYSAIHQTFHPTMIGGFWQADGTQIFMHTPDDKIIMVDDLPFAATLDDLSPNGQFSFHDSNFDKNYIQSPGEAAIDIGAIGAAGHLPYLDGDTFYVDGSWYTVANGSHIGTLYRIDGVPEPASLSLVGVAICFLGRRRGRA